MRSLLWLALLGAAPAAAQPCSALFQHVLTQDFPRAEIDTLGKRASEPNIEAIVRRDLDLMVLTNSYSSNINMLSVYGRGFRDIMALYCGQDSPTYLPILLDRAEHYEGLLRMMKEDAGKTMGQRWSFELRVASRALFDAADLLQRTFDPYFQEVRRLRSCAASGAGEASSC
ncbi:MAG: hypothetical protein IAE99_08285 [Rhodothermales bacterium]|nr:hypothetical protein [Rhodothermales bacterium]